MRYTYFEVVNFKGIRKLKLDFQTPPRAHVTTLVGLNESGKTTILEAIDYFRAGTEELDPMDLSGQLRPEHHQLIPIAQRANFNDSIIVRAGVELSSSDEASIAAHLKREHKFTLASLSSNFTITDKYNFTNSVYKDRSWTWSVEITGSLGRAKRVLSPTASSPIWQACADYIQSLIPRIWYFPNFLFDIPDRIYLEERSGESTGDKFYRALLRDILYAVDPAATFEEHIVTRVNSNKAADAQALRQLLLLMSRRVETDVFTTWNRVFHRQMNRRLEIALDVDEGGLWFVEFRIEDADGFFSINERSLGFRWFFVFSLLSTYRGQRQGPTSNVLFLFDEPASNLHSSAQEQLLGSINRLTENASVIYTTHSQYLINPNWLESTYIVTNEALNLQELEDDTDPRTTDIGISRYRSFVSRYPDQTRYFQPILDVLEYAPSNLELVPDLVLTEGKNDFYGLKFIHDVILKKTDDIHFGPGGGAGTMDQTIMLYLSWGRDFVVLLDSDGAGATQKRRYLNRFGPIVRDRLYLLEELEPSLKGKSLEGVFEKSDRDAILQLTYPGLAYTKTRFARAIQEALATKQSVSLTEPTRARFEQILKTLAEKLAAVKVAPDGT